MVSVVTTVYNDEKYITRFIDGILSQTYMPDEIVIADGGSTDRTKEIINDYIKNNENIRLVVGERWNIGQGFNKAIENSKNDNVIIMAVGNVYDKDFIKEMIYTYKKEHSKSSNTEIICAPIRGKNNTFFNKLYNTLCNNMNVGIESPSNHGVLVNKRVFRNLGLFCEDFFYAGEDAEFFLRRVACSKFEVVCSKKSKLYWDIPENFVEFKKQIKMYSIGEMQWAGRKGFVFDVVYDLFLTIIMPVLFIPTFLRRIVRGAIAILLAIKSVKKLVKLPCEMGKFPQRIAISFFSELLGVLRHIMRAIYAIKYQKYSRENKVNYSNVRYLM